MHKKPGRTALMLAVTAALACAGWRCVTPLLSSKSETVYESYVTSRRDITTTKSFSASLNVLNSETHSNARQVSSIRKLYVQSGQQVRKNDKLLQLDDGTIYRAGIDGMVNEIRFNEGDWVWPNVQLVQVCDLENLQVSLQVDEYDVDQVAAGQPCTVSIVASGLDFETEIAHVNRLSSSSGSVAYYDVTAELTVPENVLPGMTASVSIPAEEALNAVALEMGALSFNDSKQPYVWVNKDGVYEERLLETGLNDGMYVEVISGLEEGDVVYTAREQAAEAGGFSLASLYKQLVGETIVINDMSDSGRERGGAGEATSVPRGTQPQSDPEFSGGGMQ